MKAMILAAGLGLRMRPLSDLVAKPALPVLNRPLLHWTLELLARHGIRDVLVNTHHRPETIERAVGTGRPFGLRVRYSQEPVILGSGGGPRRVRAFLGREPALLVNGDCVFDFDLTRLLRHHHLSGALATLALKANSDPARYGPVVCDSRGFVRSIRRLPRPARGTVSLFTGVQVICPEILERLPEGPSDIVATLYAPLLAQGGLIRGVRVRGPWLDLGTPSQYRAAQMTLLRTRGGRAAAGTAGPLAARRMASERTGLERTGLERTADGSLVAAGARVGPGAQVLGTVLGKGCVVERGAVVRASVLWEGARVGEGARVSSCIVTAGARVAAGERLKRLIVMPESRVPIG